MSSQRVNVLVIALALGVAAAAVTYGYFSSHPPGVRPIVALGGLQLLSSSVQMTGLNRTDLSMDFNAVVYNPTDLGAVLVSANYSVYASGHYLGSGRTSHSYYLAPHSSETFALPFSVAWKSAFETTGRFLLDWGHTTWEIEGRADINVSGLPLSAPFEFSIG